MLGNSHLLTFSEIPANLPPVCASLPLIDIDLCVLRRPIHEPWEKLANKGEKVEGMVPDPWTTQKQGIKAESGIKSGPALRMQGQVTSESQERFLDEHSRRQKQTQQAEHLKTLKLKQSHPRKKGFQASFIFIDFPGYDSKSSLQPCIREAIYSFILSITMS